MAATKFSRSESEDEPLIIDSERAWNLSAMDMPYATERDLRIAIQGHILRCGWAIQRLMNGEPGDFGSIQQFRFSEREDYAAGSSALVPRLIAELLALARDGQMEKNRSPQAAAFAAACAKHDPAVQGVISKAIKAAGRKRGKGAV